MTVSRPSKRDTLRGSGFFAGFGEFRAEFIDNRFGFKVPNLDTATSGSTQPVTVGGEAECVDDIASFQTVKVFAFVQIPEHGDSVLTTRSAKRTIGGNGDGVNITSVTDVVGSEFALCEIPNFDNSVPAAGNDAGSVDVGGESNTADPFLVSVFNVVFTFTQSVPELDALVTRTGDDLTVIGRERDGKDISVVSDETAGSGTVDEVPKTEGLVPGGGQSELTVRGDDNILDKVVVSSQSSTGDTVIGFVSGELPDNDRLISGRGKDHIRGLRGSCNSSDPVVVAFQLASQYKGVLAHF